MTENEVAMQSPIKRRLGTIEAHLAAQEAETIRVIIVREDTAGHAAPESIVIHRPEQPPQCISRNPSEPAAAFLRRAGCAAPTSLF